MTTNKTPSDTTASASVAGVEGAELPVVAVTYTVEELVPLIRHTVTHARILRTMPGGIELVRLSDAQARIDSISRDAMVEIRDLNEQVARLTDELNEWRARAEREATICNDWIRRYNNLAADLTEARAERDALSKALTIARTDRDCYIERLTALQAAHREASPLPKHSVEALFRQNFPRTKISLAWIGFARAIERAHGIGYTSSPGEKHGD